MPIIDSTFAPPVWLRSGHLQTILPTLARRVDGVHYQRERMELEDGDFIDLDWSRLGSDRLAIVSHGLEGNSSRAYVRGLVRALNDAGLDALAWNYRGCSGEPNRLLRSYHSGASDDLALVIDHVASKYAQIALIGFSLGGNITLKYLGERGSAIDSRVRTAIAFSVPCDLASSAVKLATASNAIYMRRFMTTLREKVKSKRDLLPPEIPLDGIDSMQTFLEFDHHFTAPIHGFADGPDYWKRASSRPLLGGITIPTLLVNAVDDPFLTPECFPFAEARASEMFSLEAPRHGGHVGFMLGGNGYWAERRTIEHLHRTMHTDVSGPR
jgi:predicted alpha/beta-fold hydrolase